MAQTARFCGTMQGFSINLAVECDVLFSLILYEKKYFLPPCIEGAIYIPYLYIERVILSLY